MENYQGDLTDILRATGSSASSSNDQPSSNWQLSSVPMNLPGFMDVAEDSFGDPFLDTRDPILHGLDMPGPGFFGKPDLMNTIGSAPGDDEMKRAYTMFPQITPNAADNQQGCFVDNIPISSIQNPGKRRKGQEKKVMCVAAPASSRPSSGEVIPSDMWAWRKYGQKPIKGSPYPRGYYRCSSSKECLARKQVERSRTDPNMLVITYTSEHNHPWPTQRNALAGSTRAQPSKNSRNPSHQPIKEEDKESTSSSVKEEINYEQGFTLNPNQCDEMFSNLGQLETDPFNLFDWSNENKPF